MFITTGSTITFSSGFLSEILEITGPNATRNSIETSHMGTVTAHTFAAAKLVDWGENGVDIAFVPSTKPPMNSAEESVVVTWSDSTASVWTFNGFATGFELTGTLEERATASMTIKVSGDITVT